MPPDTRRKTVIHAVGSAFVSILTLLMLVLTSLNVWRFQQAAGWPTVAGTIVESTHVRDCGGAGKAYRPALRYKYEVDGIERDSQQVVFGGERCGSESSAKAVVAQYPVGARIRVSVDPQDPARAVLMVGQVSLDTWGPMAVFSILFLLSATAAGVYTVRARSGPSSQPAS